MCIDLHIHSTFSDGESTPQEILALAHRNGIHTISLTDHDTIAGVQVIMDLAQAEKHDEHIHVIPGIELSAKLQERHVHILGYGIEFHDPGFLSWLAPLQNGRAIRNSAIIQKLQHLGLSVTMEEVKKIAGGEQVGRPHIARLLVEKGYVQTRDQAFRFYLAHGKPAYQDRFLYSAIECIDVIHKSGGIAVLAHPGQLDTSGRTLPAYIEQLRLRGLDGLEAIHPVNSHGVRKLLKKIAQRDDLIMTGGSDFHGRPDQTQAFSGHCGSVCPPDSFLLPFFQRLERIQGKKKSL